MSARPLRVALVTPRFPPDVGGLEEYVGWVARTLRGAGHDVVVVATTPGRRRQVEQHDGFTVHRLASWFTLSNTPVNAAWWWQLPSLLRELQVDVVNAHAPVPGLADVAAFRSPVPVVLTYHSGSMVKGHSAVDPALRAYERRVLTRVLDRCEHLVAVSPVSLAHATGRAHLIPPGVDTDLFTPPAPAAPRQPRVLYVGRVERSSRWKGLQVLVDALPRLLQLVPEARLEVVGDGDDVPALRTRAQSRGVATAIDWTGRLPHAELGERYRCAGVTVLPSTSEAESFGMTLVEAMASGCPVVGSAVGGIPFVVRDGVDGLLVPPGEPEALARALVDVLLDPARASAMGKAGRDAAEQRWDWTHQAELTVRTIEGAATRGRRGVAA